MLEQPEYDEKDKTANGKAEGFLQHYLAYTKDTESPRIFHRWCALSSIGALLGRNFWFEHGHFNVYPNLYCMLIGEPGTRKSTAIKLSKKMLQNVGYDSIAADRSTKEKFLVDLEGEDKDGDFMLQADKQMEKNLWGEGAAKEARECFIMADEFNDFIGLSNFEFISLLGSLWDYEGTYESKVKNGKSVAIFNPTISILGGNTQQSFALAFPPEIAGQGFLSRLLLIHGETNGRRITFPEKPAADKLLFLTRFLEEMQLRIRGKATLTADAARTLDAIYKGDTGFGDARFRFYSTRRFTQLLKLVLICAACRHATSLETEHIIEANTILAAAEEHMPKALGEFGKGKNSAAANKVVEALGVNTKALNLKDLWKLVHKDLDKPSDLSMILQGLETAEKIFHVAGKGWLLKAEKKRDSSFVDAKYLTAEEIEGH